MTRALVPSSATPRRAPQTRAAGPDEHGVTASIALDPPPRMLVPKPVHRPGPGNPHTETVRRAVVAQLELGTPPVSPEGDTAVEPNVTRVSIVGRPPPTFTNSMGDHSTAFTVHVNAVQLALEGLPLRGAADRLNEMIKRLGLLPGTQILGNLPKRQAGMWTHAYKRLSTAATAMLHPSPGDSAVGALQECIAAYLELRELVPLSTVNTGTVSKATAGKGKGEDVDALRAQSAGVPQSLDRLTAEIVGALDIRAVALASIETEQDRLDLLAPGLTAKMTGEEKAFGYVVQHLRSLQTSFPGSLSAIVAITPDRSPDGDVTKDRDAARTTDEKAIELILPDLMHRAVLPLAKALLSEELPVQRDALEQTRRDLRALGPPSAETSGTKRKRNELEVGLHTQSANKRRQDLTNQELVEWARVNRIEKELGADLTPAMTFAPIGTGPVTTSGRPSRGKQTQFFSPSQVDAEQKAAAREVRVDNEMNRLAAPPPVAKSAEQIEEENERVGALAVQVILNDKGVITDMRSAGRPPSPFGNTMGAHTTAWTVHVDRVRQLITGSTPAAARKLVDKDLAAERKDMVKDLDPAFSFPADHFSVEGTAVAEHFDDVASLQNAIVRHLEQVNMIPGATLPAADIDGKYEAGHRRVLLEHLGLQHFATAQRDHSPDELRAAIVGLIDVGSVQQDGGASPFDEIEVDTDEKPVQRLVLHHLKTIEATYPGALAAAKLGAVKDLRSPAVALVTRLATAEDGPKKKRAKTAKEEAKVKEPSRSASGLVPISVPWDASAFGPQTTQVYDPLALLPTLSYLGGRRQGGKKPLTRVGKPWLDADGDLLADRLAEMVAAYRKDLRLPSTYLGQVEGGAVAQEYRVAVDVYRDTAPGGYRRIENVGGGDCLIHALSDVRRGIDLQNTGTALNQIVDRLGPAAGRAVSSGDVAAVRSRVDGRIEVEAVEHAVIDIVHNEIDGRGTQGLGPNIVALLFSPGFQVEIGNVSVRQRRAEAEKAVSAKEAQAKANAEKARALRAEKVAALKAAALLAGGTAPLGTPSSIAPIGTGSEVVMSDETLPDAGITTDVADSMAATDEGTDMVVEPVSGKTGGDAGPPKPVQAQERYPSDGAPHPDFALLHTGGNHYVALVRTT